MEHGTEATERASRGLDALMKRTTKRRSNPVNDPIRVPIAGVATAQLAGAGRRYYKDADPADDVLA